MHSKTAMEFQLLDGTVLVGFLSQFGYVGISSYENEVCGIWGEDQIIYSNQLNRPIFYKSGDCIQPIN